MSSDDMPDDNYFGDEEDSAVRSWSERVVKVTDKWFTEAPPKRQWLLRDGRRATTDGVFPMGKVGQLIAEGGAGKTLASLSLAIAIATGTKWLDTFSVRQGRVLVVLGEEDCEEAWRRVYNVTRKYTGPRIDPEKLSVLPLAGVACAMVEVDQNRNPQEAAFLFWLRAYLKRADDWALIIIDPLSRFAGADAEKDNAAATRFVQALESLATQTGASVLVVHHTNKIARIAGRIDASSGRGSSAIVDGVRLQMALNVERVRYETDEENERLGEIVTLSWPKSNYARKADDLALRRDLDHGGALVPLDEEDRKAVADAKKAAADKRRKEKFGKGSGETDEQRVERKRKLSAEKEAELRERDQADDATAAEVVASNPGATTRELRASIMAKRTCGVGRAGAALDRIRLILRSDGQPTE